MGVLSVGGVRELAKLDRPWSNVTRSEAIICPNLQWGSTIAAVNTHACLIETGREHG